MTGTVSLKGRRIDLDILKAIAIIAVVLYHIGWLGTGYLGVDIFFAINGFLIIPSLLQSINGGGTADFKYFRYINHRIMRLWPLILIATCACLAIGAIGMLPDDYENLSQSVIASNFFSQNILSSITTKNYWDAVNDFKPLMHMWYIGILIEFYILFPLLMLLIKKISNYFRWNSVEISKIFIWILFSVSFLLYLLPTVPNSFKFYHLPYRLFEILAGGLVGIYMGIDGNSRMKPLVGKILVIGLILILGASLFLGNSSSEISPVTGRVSEELLISQNILLICTVLITCIILTNRNWIGASGKIVKGIAFIGVISFSIFVWHQIILAFYRYFHSTDMNILFVTLLFVSTVMISVLTYYYIERTVKANKRGIALCGLLLFLSTGTSLWIYLNAGIIRDVPELNIKVGNGEKGMFAKYCDRIYGYDKDFNASNDSSTIKVLVVGNSFARDFANILLESQYANKIELSYLYDFNIDAVQRFSACDYLFIFSKKSEVPKFIWSSLQQKTKVYGIGTKNFGDNNGQVYQYRNKKNYHNLTVQINSNFYKANEILKDSWGEDNYIDLLALSEKPDYGIRVFSDEGKFISQDCRHLTEFGAKWFAKVIDWNKIFN